MKNVRLVFLFASALSLVACGGSGGSGNAHGSLGGNENVSEGSGSGNGNEVNNNGNENSNGNNGSNESSSNTGNGDGNTSGNGDLSDGNSEELLAGCSAYYAQTGLSNPSVSWFVTNPSPWGCVEEKVTILSDFFETSRVMDTEPFAVETATLNYFNSIASKPAGFDEFSIYDLCTKGNLCGVWAVTEWNGVATDGQHTEMAFFADDLRTFPVDILHRPLKISMLTLTESFVLPYSDTQFDYRYSVDSSNADPAWQVGDIVARGVTLNLSDYRKAFNTINTPFDMQGYGDISDFVAPVNIGIDEAPDGQMVRKYSTSNMEFGHDYLVASGGHHAWMKSDAANQKTDYVFASSVAVLLKRLKAAIGEGEMWEMSYLSWSDINMYRIEVSCDDISDECSGTISQPDLALPFSSDALQNSELSEISKTFTFKIKKKVKDGTNANKCIINSSNTDEAVNSFVDENYCNNNSKFSSVDTFDEERKKPWELKWSKSLN